MKFLFDIFPVLVFFIAYKLGNLMVATQLTIVASLIQVFWQRWRTGQFHQMTVVSFLVITLLGGATLLFQDALFVKWKPTAVYWLMGLGFYLSQWFQDKPLLQRLAEGNISLPTKVWRQLNLSWALFFLLMGGANLYVIYHFSTDVWVNFKLFGTTGLTVVFILVQAYYMSKHSPTRNGNP